MEQLIAFMDKFAALLPLLAVAAPLVAFVIDLLKRVKLPDGTAPIVSGVLNAGVLVLLFVYGDEGVTAIKKANDLIVIVGPAITVWVGMVLTAPKWHDLFKAIGLGFSHVKDGLSPVG